MSCCIVAAAQMAPEGESRGKGQRCGLNHIFLTGTSFSKSGSVLRNSLIIRTREDPGENSVFKGNEISPTTSIPHITTQTNQQNARPIFGFPLAATVHKNQVFFEVLTSPPVILAILKATPKIQPLKFGSHGPTTLCCSELVLLQFDPLVVCSRHLPRTSQSRCTVQSNSVSH